MGYFLTAFVCAFLGSLPLDIGQRGWLKKWAILGCSLLITWWLFAYFGLPQLIGPFWGEGVAFMILAGLTVNMAARFIIEILYVDVRCRRRVPVRARWLIYVISAGVFFLFLGRGCAGNDMFRANEYREFVQSDHEHEQSEWTSDMSQIDVAHIRTVSEAQARRSMGIALGQAQETSLGSRFQIGSLTIQRVGQNLVWVAPLEFTGFRTWQRYGTTAGYLIMSATDSDAEARLVDNLELCYMRSAYFGDNLERHIYENGYRFRGYTDYTFELDDNGNPFWAVTLFTPTIAYWGERIDGVLIVNPTTGEMHEYSGDEIPAWVDRVVPQDFAFTRLTNFGLYVQGWWNSVWAKQNIRVPTPSEETENMGLVWGTDNRAYWFTGLTSINATDNSLIGFALMDSRTGHTRFYRATGSDEVDIIHAVNSEVSNYANYHATRPILYNIYGEMTWVVPIITPEGMFQRLALAHGPTGRVVTGENRTEALAAYRRLLVSSGNQVTPTSTASYMVVRGLVQRIQGDVREGNTIYYVLLACGENNCGLQRSDGANIETPPDVRSIIFTGSSELSSELPLTQIGDEVELRFLETEENTVALSAFDLLRFSERQPTTI